MRKAVRVQTKVAPDRFDVRQLRWATVSPDGGRVVYSALGRLYLKELPAGAPRRLTKADDRFELFPSFSRDGARLVFTTWNDTSAGGVRTLELASGRETLLTKRPGLYLEPRFSPDGRTVVYTKSRGSYLLSPWPAGETGVFRVASDGSGEPVRIREIADAHGIPSRFLVQILLQLKGAGIVQSTRGASGGYQLARDPAEITLGDVMSAVDGQSGQITSNAATQTPTTRVLHSAWQKIAAVEREMLAGLTPQQVRSLRVGLMSAVRALGAGFPQSR